MSVDAVKARDQDNIVERALEEFGRRSKTHTRISQVVGLGMAAWAVILLLSQATNELTRSHVKALRDILKLDGYRNFGRYHPPGLVLAALKCLIRIGDTEILKSVENLSKSAHEPEVRAAALAGLPALREQIPERRMTDTLLRPDEVHDNQLLRPASGTSSSEQLLLPSDRPT